MKEMDCVEVAVEKKDMLRKVFIRVCRDGSAMLNLYRVVG